MFKFITRVFNGFGFGLGMSTAFYIFPKIENMSPEEYSDYKKKIISKSRRFLIKVNNKIEENDDEDNNDK